MSYANTSLVVLALLAGICSAQICFPYESCSACSATSSCGWCSAISACWPGNSSGPSNPFQSCPSPAWNFGKCRPIKLQEGTPYAQQHLTPGTYDNYVYLPQDNSVIEVYIDANGIYPPPQTLYASQKYQYPQADQFTWTNVTTTNYLLIAQTSGEPVYISALNHIQYHYKIVVHQPPV